MAVRTSIVHKRSIVQRCGRQVKRGGGHPEITRASVCSYDTAEQRRDAVRGGVLGRAMFGLTLEMKQNNSTKTLRRR